MKETQHIEWKQSWRDEYLKWICGFANAAGGVLIIGKNDKGQVVDLANAKKLLEDIPNKVRDLLGIMVDVNLRQENDRDVLEIVVEPYPYPISYKGEYHYRSGSTKQILKGAALDRFLLRKQGRHWDGVPAPHVAVGDLDAQALGYFRKQALRSQRLSPEILNEPDWALLQKLHLTEGTYLTRAAALLFHAEPERVFTGAYIKIGFFESNVDLRYHDEVHGNLFTQSNQTIEILHAKYLKALISYDGLQRIETYPVPEPALREALLNAVVHKDYGSGIPIQISVYPDKLMIWNPGQLPPDWNIENLLGKHSSEPFNPDIANAFFRAGKIEAWGRGIERILEACAAAAFPVPEFRYEKTGLWTVFPFSDEQIDSGRRTGGTPQETTQDRLGEKLGEKLGETRAAIVKAMLANPKVTTTQLARSLNISTTAVENNLKFLKDQGHIKRVGPAKGGHWEVLP